MSLYDFFFPEQAQAAHLRKLAGEAVRSRELDTGSLEQQNRQLHERVARLEHELGALALVVAAILKRLDEKGHVTRNEVQETIRKLDLLDGVRDGKISVDDLGAGDFFDSP
jgi:hypothetical protein